MESNGSLAPDEAALAADLAGTDFLDGVDREWWRLQSRDGVIAVFDITAATGRTVRVRVDFTGYPTVAPTSMLWCVTADAPMPISAWPQGGRASQVFNVGWSPQFGGAFYFPYDRQALAGHECWAFQYPGHVWGADKTVTHLLRLIRDVLRAATYPPLKTAATNNAGDSHSIPVAS